MVEVRGDDRRKRSRARRIAASRVEVFDVWSRSGSKYRVRAVVLLVLNVLLFGGLGCFAYWLRTGDYFAPAMPDYWGQLWRTCLPGADSHTLTSLLTHPINFEEVPLQIVIHGLLLSALVSIPILVSVLYRFYSCLPFIVVVGFVAMMPWLALTLLGSCVLASVRPFRFSFRYASALLGLVLVVVYILAVSLQNLPAAAVLENPGHRVKLVAPWILAVLASCVLLGLGLGLAKVVNYRPGVIAPLLALMFALPVALFEQYVGRDEMYYRLIEHKYGPKSTYFRDRDVLEDFDRGVARERDALSPGASYDEVAGLREVRWHMQLGSTEHGRNMFVAYQERAAWDCDWFIKYFPNSRYALAVLYLKGRVLDMRVDLARLRNEKQLVFYDTFPSYASRETWDRLLANADGSPFTAVALYRRAVLDVRGGKVDSAIERLRRLVEYKAPSASTQAAPPAEGLRGLLERTPPESGLRVSVDAVVLEGERLLQLLERNRDPLYADDPLTGPRDGAEFPRLGWMLFDPASEHYRRNLKLLLERYPECALSDNIEVELARTLADPAERARELERTIDKLMRGDASAQRFRDAVPEAIYRLGETYLVIDKPAEARRAFERLIGEYPDTIWRERAEARLAAMGPAAAMEP